MAVDVNSKEYKEACKALKTKVKKFMKELNCSKAVALTKIRDDIRLHSDRYNRFFVKSYIDCVDSLRYKT